MKTLKNQHEQVLWYLYNWDSFSLKDIINDSFFHKFQTRLSELENKYGELTVKTRKKFINRFGNKSSYYIYKQISNEKTLEIWMEII